MLTASKNSSSTVEARLFVLARSISICNVAVSRDLEMVTGRSSNADHAIESVCATVDNYTPPDELVMAVDVPQVVQIGYDIHSPVDGCVVTKHVAESIDATK